VGTGVCVRVSVTGGTNVWVTVGIKVAVPRTVAVNSITGSTVLVFSIAGTAVGVRVVSGSKMQPEKNTAVRKMIGIVLLILSS